MPLLTYNAEFRKFHFQDLLALDHEVNAAELLAAPGLSWHCRCMRDKIGTIPLHRVKVLNDSIEAQGDQYSDADYLENLLEYYDRKMEEMQQRKALEAWKHKLLKSELEVEEANRGAEIEIRDSFQHLII